MTTKTLGEVIRMMVENALSKDDLTCTARVSDMAVAVNGNPADMPENDMAFKLPGLKSSYIYNTTSRIASLTEKGLKATHQFGIDDDGMDTFTIKLIKGSYGIGARKRNDNQAAIKAVEDFKAKVMKVMPDISQLDEDSALIAMRAIKAMKDIIEEMK